MENKINEREDNNILSENSNNLRLKMEDERINKCYNIGRISAKEILDITNKEEYERKNKNDLKILKIEEKNFLDKILLLEDSDFFLKIKKIVFKNINDLFSDNLLIFKNLRQYEIKDNSNENEKKQIEELEKESNNLNLEEIIFKNCQMNDINFSNLFPIIKKFKLIN